MGIEPTRRTVDVRRNGFEDRGRHQACKHFPRLDPGNRQGHELPCVPRPWPRRASIRLLALSPRIRRDAMI
jgi:hypothetical protein